jgi:hypothetical protein
VEAAHEDAPLSGSLNWSRDGEGVAGVPVMVHRAAPGA